MAGSFQPAKLDVDPSILDSRLSFVDTEDEMDSMFKQMSSSRPKIENLIPETEYPSLTVYPKSGLCVKTRNAAGVKFFINLCRLGEIPPPTPISEQELQRLIADEDYTNLWRVPMSIGAPREDKDKTGVLCYAADIAVNSTWFQDTMEPSLMFTTFVITVAMEGLCDKYGEVARLDRDGWTVLKNKKYLGGLIPPHSIQKRANTGISELNRQSAKIEEIGKTKEKQAKDCQKIPLYKIEKNFVKNPTELEASIYLPGVGDSKHINLDIGGDRLVLETSVKNYLLDIFLPYSLNPDLCRATYQADTQILRVNLPLLV